MTVIDRFEELPTPVKVAGAVGAGVGLLVFLLKGHNAIQQAPPSSTVAPTAPLGALTLPAGAGVDNAGGIQQNTLDLVNGIVKQSSDSLTAMLKDQSLSNQAALAAQNAALAGVSKTLTDAQAAQAANDAAANKSLLDQIIALGAKIAAGTPVVTTPAPAPAPAPAPTPIQAPQPIGAATPTGPAITGGNGVSTAGSGRFLSSITGWMGSGLNAVIGTLGGNNYMLGATYTGNGSWQPGGRQEPGTVDPATGLIIPVAYNSGHDIQRNDWSTHAKSESSYATVARWTLDIMNGHPGVSQYEAFMSALSRYKNQLNVTGVPLYNGGFDFGSVPDGYGRGTYWN